MTGVRVAGYRIPPKEVVGGLILWGLVATVLFDTRDLPLISEGAPGPRLMPVLLAALLSVLAVLYWVEAAVRVPAAEAESETRNFVRPLGFLSITILLALGWEPLGAVLTVLACSVLELRFLERFSWPRTLAASLAIGAVVLVLFQFILGVQLPGGPLEPFLEGFR